MSSLVVNRHHKKPYDVYIGRGSIWGNPYSLEDHSRREALELYESYLRANAELIGKLPDLHGKVLGCYCAPRPCHGDILAAFSTALVAEGELPEELFSASLFHRSGLADWIR